MVAAWRVTSNVVRRRHMATGGRALVARLRMALKDAGVPLWLKYADDRAGGRGGTASSASRSPERGGPNGFAAGTGCCWPAAVSTTTPSCVRQCLPEGGRDDHSLGAKENTGDGIKAGLSLGAALDFMDDAWWMPSVEHPSGASIPLVSERAIPGRSSSTGTVGASPTRRRPTSNFVHDQLDGKHLPTWCVMDARARSRYPFAQVLPGVPFPKAFYEAGTVHRADTIRELATAIGLPVDNLVATVERFNGFATSGIDEDFGRGRSAYDHYYGDPTLPNPNLDVVDKAPFYAIRIEIGDLGTKGGLVCDERTRVLREDGSVIEGLYATGNASASVMANEYAGSGRHHRPLDRLRLHRGPARRRAVGGPGGRRPRAGRVYGRPWFDSTRTAPSSRWSARPRTPTRSCSSRPRRRRAFDYRPGQFLTLRVPRTVAGGAARCYSLSLPAPSANGSRSRSSGPATATARTGSATTWCEGDEIEVLRPAGTLHAADAGRRLPALRRRQRDHAADVDPQVRPARGPRTRHPGVRQPRRAVGDLPPTSSSPWRSSTPAGCTSSTCWSRCRASRASRRCGSWPARTPPGTCSSAGRRPSWTRSPTASRDSGSRTAGCTTSGSCRWTTTPSRSRTSRWTTAARPAPSRSSWTATSTSPWPGRKQQLLDVLLAAGLDAPFSCREGAVQRLCVRPARGRDVEMGHNEVLEKEDIADGIVLACQAAPASATVSGDPDREAGRRPCGGSRSIGSTERRGRPQ